MPAGPLPRFNPAPQLGTVLPVCPADVDDPQFLVQLQFEN
jgi:hypothetical protein